MATVRRTAARNDQLVVADRAEMLSLPPKLRVRSPGPAPGLLPAVAGNESGEGVIKLIYDRELPTQLLKP